MPPVITPSGLSLTRSLYLYKKVREYICDPKKKDKVCPKPSQSSEANSSYLCGNASSYAVAENDKPRPSSLTYSLQMTLTVNCRMKAIAVFLAGGNADPGLN